MRMPSAEAGPRPERWGWGLALGSESRDRMRCGTGVCLGAGTTAAFQITRLLLGIHIQRAGETSGYSQRSPLPAERLTKVSPPSPWAPAPQSLLQTAQLICSGLREGRITSFVHSANKHMGVLQGAHEKWGQ